MEDKTEEIVKQYPIHVNGKRLQEKGEFVVQSSLKPKKVFLH